MRDAKREEKAKGVKAKETGGKAQKFEELLSSYETGLKGFREGQIVKGKIIRISKSEVLVDIGYKSEGVILLSEFTDPQAMKVGDEIEVLLEQKEDEAGMVVLSKRKADRARSWEQIIEKCEEGSIVEGKIFKKVKGGLMVDIGMEAFLPGSLVSLRPTHNLDQFIGQDLKFKIVKMNKRRKNVVLSHRDFLQEERLRKREKLLEELEVGQICKGVVKNITDFGAFIDLGGIDGLLHITDMSWSRISHPSEMLAVGDEIEAMVLKIEKAEKRISLGLKQKTQSPWGEVEKKYPVGSRVKGKVVNIVAYGAFVELEKGVEGLVHISELSWTRRVSHPSEMLAIGDIVECQVLNIDQANEKISLGIKQTEADPWLLVEERYKVGSKITGKVRNLTDHGAFIELEKGIDGFLHLSDMSWTKKINHPSEFLKRGKAVETVVLSVDKAKRKISLGLKQLIPDPWSDISKRYRIDSIIKGSVTKITNFGIFIELEKDVEGLVHISQIELDQPADLKKLFKVGDTVKAKVIKIDDTERKIGLGIKGLK